MTRISEGLRKQVWERAAGLCEYCLLPEKWAFFTHEVDHIISEKHGGETAIENLALACFDCNRFKGPNIASIDLESGQLVPMFNPRTQIWSEHFSIIDVGEIMPLTAVGRVTEHILRLNLLDRVEVRETLTREGHYP